MSLTRTMVCKYFIALPSSEHLRGSWRLDVDRLTRGNELAGDHLLVALPRPHHRVDPGIRVDHHFEEGGAGKAEELGDDARHVRLALEARGIAKAVGLRSLDEVLLVQRAIARRQAALEEQL